MTAAYDTIGLGYAARRRPDPRIAHIIRATLDGCQTVLNVGAGAGSYEPADLDVIAVEPSQAMIRQRGNGTAPVVQGRAEMLPFPDTSFDAVMGVLTLHHWSDVRSGLAECRRVARDRIVFLTVDVEASGQFWLLKDYFPDIQAMDRETMPSLDLIRTVLGPLDVSPVNIPADCVDGFLGAYWRRPEAYLDPAIRACISVFHKIPDVDRGIETLRDDLATGRWARRHRQLLDSDAADLGYRLVSARVG
jgi:SAM-dependent methyltransferase